MRFALIALAAAIAAPSPAAEAPAPPIEIEALAQLPFLSDPILSPDGRHLVARVNANGVEKLAVYDVDASRDTPPKFVDHPGTTHWFDWAGSGKLLVGNTLFSLVIGNLPLRLTRLTSYDLETGKTTPLTAGDGFIGDNVIFTDPDGRYVLVSAQKNMFDSPSVWRIDLASGAATEIRRKKADIWQWIVDDSGSVRGGISYTESGWTIYREDGPGGDLKRAAVGRFRPEAETAIDAIGLLSGGDSGFIVTNERTGRFGAYRYDLYRQTIGEPIFEHPEADVTDVRVSADRRTIEAVEYEDDLPHTVWQSAELKALQAQIDRTFPGKVNRILNFSRDRNRLLIWTGSPDDPGGYYVFDRKAHRMDAFAAPYEALIDRRLAPVKPVRYAARDGLSIRAYLTLPAGREAKGLPLIVMPHGGPFARTRYEFDPLVQLLASRGYAVLQPNFRGSTGFGREFVERGYGEWGGKMQDDLDDGVAWLAAQGTIDPKRVCLVGASYGGYAALWGVIRNPEIYRCAASLAGVTDIRAMLKYDSRTAYASRYSKLWRRKVEGEEKRDLAAVSPLQQAARLKVPVLVAHGELDGTVPADQSRQLVKALKAAGGRVQSVFYPAAGHGFTRSADQADFMKRLEAFLQLHDPADGLTVRKGGEAELVAGAPTAGDLLASGRKPKTAAMKLHYQVTVDGTVTDCTVPETSGVGDLDKLACALAEQQLQYRPVVDASGRPQASDITYRIAFDKDKSGK